MIFSSILEAATRVALLPSFSDFDQRTPMRTSLATFDARLQAELSTGWDAEVLARAGLSAVVFEQKLRATASAGPALRVLPSEILILSVLDQPRQELRVHVSRVGEGMKLADAKVFKVQDAKALSETLPKEIARYIGTVAKLAERKPATAKAAAPADARKALTCALLEPVSAGGVQADLSKISPLIHALLENAVAGGSGGIQLVERAEISRILDEKTLIATQEWNANTASEVGSLVKADLILVPFIHFQDATRIGTDLFAIDVATGRVLACRSWSGGLLDAPPADAVKELLQAGGEAARDSAAHTVADDPKLRHAEAAFIIDLQDGWNGLRQQAATEAELASRLGDASLALASDDDALMSRAVVAFFSKATPCAPHPLSFEYAPQDDWIKEIAELKKSGQLAVIDARARQIFELPMTERAKTHGDVGLGQLARFYVRTGDAAKAWSLLSAGGRSARDLAMNDEIYDDAVVTLMNLGRYQDCIDLLETRKKWSKFCTPFLFDAHRALKNPQREFEVQWNYRNSISGDDRLAHFIDLGRETGQAAKVIGYMLTGGHGWYVNQPASRLAFVRARVAAGQKELAISDARCALLAAGKEKDAVAVKQLTAILKDLGATPLATLPLARDFIKLPREARIDLIHDQTIDPGHAREVATHLATFWGCAVHVRTVKLDATKLAGYNSLPQTVDGMRFGKSLLRVDLPAGPSLGTVFLTRTKLVSTTQKFQGDIYSAPAGSLTVVSDHYFRKFSGEDPRPLPLITAIAASSLNGIERAMSQAARAEVSASRDPSLSFSPLPPDLFAANGMLFMRNMDLGISPRSGGLLRSMPVQDLLDFSTSYHEAAKQEELAETNPDAPLMADLSAQLAATRPLVISPAP